MGLLNQLTQLIGRPQPTQRDVTLGGVALPAAVETTGVLLVGAVGTGKSTVIDQLLGVAVNRGDRVIVADANGFYLSRHARPGDRLLNPFDSRSERWSIFSEIRRDYDYQALARSIVPDGNGADAAWHHYAQVLLASTLRALVLRGEGSTERLLYWLTVVKGPELAELLAGTPAQGLFDKDAAKALASTRYILTVHLQPHAFMKTGDFSLRRWLRDETGNLYLTWRADMQASLKPLVSCWVDILAAAVLSLAPDPQRRVWLVLDELAALGKLSSLETALTLGRKHGLCVVAGLQSTAQLERVYGRDLAIVLRSCFRTLAAFAVAASDPDTAELLSRSLGDREVEREQQSRSQGSQGTSKSTSVQRVKERLVLPSEITALPDLTAYLALPGDEPIRRITLTPVDRRLVTSPLMEDD
jgi:type IV secretory pathway TraG/TraD family ATPase VirD4